MSDHKKRLDRLVFVNKWRQDTYKPIWRRMEGSQVFIGVQRHYGGPSRYCWRACLFGLELSVWIEKQWKK